MEMNINRVQNKQELQNLELAKRIQVNEADILLLLLILEYIFFFLKGRRRGSNSNTNIIK